MGVSLTKGGNVSLSKEAPGPTGVSVGLGWDVRTTTGTDFDLDARRACRSTGPSSDPVALQHLLTGPHPGDATRLCLLLPVGSG